MVKRHAVCKNCKQEFTAKGVDELNKMVACHYKEKHPEIIKKAEEIAERGSKEMWEVIEKYLNEKYIGRDLSGFPAVSIPSMYKEI